VFPNFQFYMNVGCYIMLWQHYSQGKSIWLPLNRRPGGTQRWSGCGIKDKNLHPRWESIPNFSHYLLNVYIKLSSSLRQISWYISQQCILKSILNVRNLNTDREQTNMNTSAITCNKWYICQTQNFGFCVVQCCPEVSTIYTIFRQPYNHKGTGQKPD
jgi:hypothetical protein